MKVNKNLLLFALLFICTMLEVLSSTQWMNAHVEITNGIQSGNNNVVSIVYLLMGLAIAIIPLIYLKPSTLTVSKKWNSPIIGIVGIATIIFAVYIITVGYQKFQQHPVDYHTADMLPVIQVMNERLLHHEQVYAFIPQFWNGELPVYLPAMWMPFLPSIAFHFDMRWITVGGLLGAMLLMLFSIRPARWNAGAMLALIPFIYLMDFHIQREYFTYTEEGIVAAFYLLLAFALMKDNIWLQGIAITLCLLSRYSFAGWVPMFFIVNFLLVSKKKTIQIAAITGVSTLILMFLSQAIYHLPFLLSLSDHYLASLAKKENEWQHQLTMLRGLGLAKFIPYYSIIWLQRALIAVTVLFPLLGYTVYRWGKNINTEFFMLAMLKLYLVLFYNLLIIPYNYLFVTSTFVSCFILYRYSKNIGPAKGLDRTVLS